MCSACSTGYGAKEASGKMALDAWKSVFPNLKTAWGYASARDYHSPSAWGAGVHIIAWEHATRGHTSALDARAAFSSTPANAATLKENVSVWTSDKGYVEGR